MTDFVLWFLIGLADGFFLAVLVFRYVSKEVHDQDKYISENKHLTSEELLARFRTRVEERRN